MKSGLGQFYQAFASNDLANPEWEAVSGVFPGNGGLLEIGDIPVNPALPRRFYRVKVWRE